MMSGPAESKHLELLRYMAESSDIRSRLSAERSAMNSERTLAAIIHTALAIMTLGLAMDRYQLVFRRFSGRSMLLPGTLTTEGGAVLILLGALLSLAGTWRYLPALFGWRRRGGFGPYAGSRLAPLFALLVSSFGGLLLAALFMHAV